MKQGVSILKQLRTRLTYANVMSTIAAFLALGGATAIATVQLSKNSVGAKQLKANAVTAAKIKGGAITTAKIGSDAVTGDKVKESTLATVPTATAATEATNAVHATSATSATSATRATDAVNAVNATNATNAENFSRHFNLGLRKASIGQVDIPLGSVGPFSFVADCSNGGGGAAEAQIYLRTSVNGSEMQSSTAEFPWNMQTVDEAEIGEVASSSMPQGNLYSAQDGWVAATPNGSFLTGEAHAMVKTLGADCAFLVYGFNETP
jgi:hypothetical protein